MHKKDFHVDLKDFKRFSKINYDSLLPVCVVREEKTRSFFIASQIMINSDQFDKKISNCLLDKYNEIIKSFSALFVRLRGFSKTDLNFGLYPVFITEYTASGTLSQVIQNEKSGDIPFDWDDTKKLINIYGIAFALLYLKNHQIDNFDLSLESIYETKKFYPKINLFNFSHINSTELTNGQSDTSLSDYYYQYATIIYSIIAGEQVKSSFLKDSYKYDHIEFKKSIPERYKKLIFDCISRTKQNSPMTFEQILDQLQNDTDFISEKVDHEQFIEYIHFLETFSEDSLIESNENPYSIDIPSLDLTKYERNDSIFVGLHDLIFQIKNKENGCFYAAKMIRYEIDNKLNFRKKILQEVKVLSQVNHPSIIEFIGYSPIDFKNQPRAVIVTKYYSNGSLADILKLEKEGNKIPFWNDTTKLIVIYGIASAMSYLHSKNIHHQDLKPENILLDDYLFPKIIDFGNSKFSNEKDSMNFNFNFNSFLFSFNNNNNDIYSFGNIVHEIYSNKKNNFLLNHLKQFLMTLPFLFLNITHKQEVDQSIPKAYKELIESCYNEFSEKRPTFSDIVNNLKENPEFLTKNVDIDLYKTYIHYIDNYHQKEEFNDSFKFSKYSLQSIYDDYRKILELKDPLTKHTKSIDIKKFKKIDSIGYGGFSKVYSIIDEQTKIIYAAKELKVISNSIADFTKRIQFSREVTILSKMKHQSIIKYIGYSSTDFKDQNKPIIVTEYLKNGSLEKLLSLERNKNENVTFFWTNTLKLINIYGIASAMSYLHSNNIIHRDLKPANILLDDYVFPKLIDFGNSKFLKSNIKNDDDNDYFEKNSNSICSYRYMAPEIFADQQCSKYSDVYSFGMTVYEILSKKVPLIDFSLEQAIYHVCMKNYRPNLKEINIPEIYKLLIKSCWNKDPQKRPSFDCICEMLENDPSFITDNDIDINYYQSYIQYIKQKQEGEETNKFDFIKISIGSKIDYSSNDESISLSSFPDLDDF